MKCPNCKKDPCICEETGEDKQYTFEHRFFIETRRKQEEMRKRRAEKRAKKAKKVNDE